MKEIWLGILLPLALTFTPSSSLALDYQSTSRQGQNLALAPTNRSFYTTALRLVQQQIFLIARLEQALTSPDANRMRSVRGQLTVQTTSVEAFLTRQYPSPKTLCTADGNVSRLSPLPVQLGEQEAQIYCSLYASSQELGKLPPVIDRLLSRRGELGLVRELPLVSGERQIDPVLSINPVQRPQLGQPAIPFASREPDLSSHPLPVVGMTAKTAIANYRPPVQPAIAAPEDAAATLKAAAQFLQAAQAGFPLGTKFIYPQQDADALDRFAYNIDSQEPQSYSKFLELPHTGIFRVLPESAYVRQPNTIENRLQASVRERYPFPSVGKSQTGFNHSLALVIVEDNFQLVQSGIDYGFIVDVGDVALEQLDQQLAAVAEPKRKFLLNYQPPKQLAALQEDRRKFITGKNQDWQQTEVFLANTPAVINHTYIVRSLQFQLPAALSDRLPISRSNSRSRQEFGQIKSSDMIIAFRPVRRRNDGSYTILWRVLNQLPTPEIDDMEEYIP
ncbi:MAG TPA: hypothetical protein VK203_24755 [Nostocaceae cyanobacterium]|nr:hypothetical protein [Nostocaceae cyanobacterium]